jgi:hypothetical protein
MCSVLGARHDLIQKSNKNTIGWPLAINNSSSAGAKCLTLLKYKIGHILKFAFFIMKLLVHLHEANNSHMNLIKKQFCSNNII